MGEVTVESALILVDQPQQFVLAQIPADAAGFEVVLTNKALPEGIVAKVVIDMRETPDSKWAHCHTCLIDNGLDKNGLSRSAVKVEWPQVHDGSKDPMGAKPVPYQDVRVTLDFDKSGSLDIGIKPLMAVTRVSV